MTAAAAGTAMTGRRTRSSGRSRTWPPSSRPPAARLWSSATPAAELAALAAGGQRGAAAELFLRNTGAPAEAVAGMRSSPYWPRMESLAHTLSYDVTLCNGGVVPADRLAGIQVPVLALAGGSSPDWARTAVREIAAVTPGGRSQVLDGQDHGPADEVLAPVLTEFFG
jgi:pimeloyl-ACP methyl ester carboxylesterase